MCVVAEPGASVLLPAPCFPAFPVAARAWGLDVRTYALSRERGFEHTARAIEAAVDDTTRLVLLNSPHNPSGVVVPTEEMAALGEMLAARGVLLAVDEVFHPLYAGTSAAERGASAQHRRARRHVQGHVAGRPAHRLDHRS